jgi:hypothetical protein
LGRSWVIVSRKATYRASNAPVALMSGWPFISNYTQPELVGIRSRGEAFATERGAVDAAVLREIGVGVLR